MSDTRVYQFIANYGDASGIINVASENLDNAIIVADRLVKTQSQNRCMLTLCNSVNAEIFLTQLGLGDKTPSVEVVNEAIEVAKEVKVDSLDAMAKMLQDNGYQVHKIIHSLNNTMDEQNTGLPEEATPVEPQQEEAPKVEETQPSEDVSEEESTSGVI